MQLSLTAAADLLSRGAALATDAANGVATAVVVPDGARGVVTLEIRAGAAVVPLALSPADVGALGADEAAVLEAVRARVAAVLAVLPAA